MKKLLTILCLVLLVSCSNEVPDDQLVERDGITYEINSQTPFTGSSVDYRDNGQLDYKRNYKNGERDGLYELFHKNGQLWNRQNYKDGIKDGIVEYFHKNGQLSNRKNIKDEKTHSLYEGYCQDGRLHRKGNYINGIEDGLHESFDCDGLLLDRKYFINGKMDGLWEHPEWNDVGFPRCYKNGKISDMSYCKN